MQMQTVYLFHLCIFTTLTFDMIHIVPDPDTGIRYPAVNLLFALQVKVLVGQQLHFLLHSIIRPKDFIYHQYNQFCAFFQ